MFLHLWSLYGMWGVSILIMMSRLELTRAYFCLQSWFCETKSRRFFLRNYKNKICIFVLVRKNENWCSPKYCKTTSNAGIHVIYTNLLPISGPCWEITHSSWGIMVMIFIVINNIYIYITLINYMIVHIMYSNLSQI